VSVLISSSFISFFQSANECRGRSLQEPSRNFLERLFTGSSATCSGTSDKAFVTLDRGMEMKPQAAVRLSLWTLLPGCACLILIIALTASQRNAAELRPDAVNSAEPSGKSPPRTS
jgi:hypothetical protein